MPEPSAGSGPRFEPGQTIIFLGDHSTPDSPGYVRVVRDVLARFYPELTLNFISAGARGQTAHGLKSQKMMDILLSSRPDWLAINLGLGDALREPQTRERYEEYRRRKLEADDAPDATLGPEYRLNPDDLGPVADVGKVAEPQLERLQGFRSDLLESIARLQQVGIRPVLFTTVLLGSDLYNPINQTLRIYSRTIREIASEQSVALVEVEQAFRDVLDRAANYKQTVSLTRADGEVNPQGEALIARHFLRAFGVLPGPGYRPSR